MAVQLDRDSTRAQILEGIIEEIDTGYIGTLEGLREELTEQLLEERARQAAERIATHYMTEGEL